MRNTEIGGERLEIDGFESIAACVQPLWTPTALLNRASDWSKYIQIKLGQRNNKLFQVQKVHLEAH